MVGVGRAVHPRRSTDLAIFQEWLRICRETHTNCRQNEDVKLPTRVLDIGSSTFDHIKLREVSGSTGSYVALSHCWGGKIAVQTTQNNLHAYKKEINFGCLPKDFQDAVTVTRSLGLKYLWIDALCIIQDSTEDWVKESGNMAAVYQNAYIVLGADMSDNAHGGFLENEEGGYPREDVPVAIVDSENTTVYARWQNKLHRNPCAVFMNGLRLADTGEPLMQRAWTLQEQLLASRMVHLARKEMIWECDSALSCECMELDRGISAENERIRYHKALNSHSADKFKIWYEVVNDAAARGLTEPSDILPALSGLAHHFQEHGAGPYLAGLWRNDLPRGLLWRTCDARNSSRASPYRAPSWSWVSIQGESAMYEGSVFDYHSELKHVYANVLEAECHTEAEDPCGAVYSGRMKVSAPVSEMTATTSIQTQESHPSTKMAGQKRTSRRSPSSLADAYRDIPGLLAREATDPLRQQALSHITNPRETPLPTNWVSERIKVRDARKNQRKEALQKAERIIKARLVGSFVTAEEVHWANQICKEEEAAENAKHKAKAELIVMGTAN
ncbi:HET-domain-containing protein [Cucurbitaria berberidis CBS 394.84]|uniref:HET-domain-containing protein n=1 Tax=Cucurbitaria berberidis CBS 394.84 TaxID=1168544 RepID=A0A9P4GQG4_9PLEO|nr:HET-domain-containing protein [Cucurbitaria berberidis CBS 394.84]KAF1849659.1 HET-domain-containing protein [Cucurbitaria berberidis CBS 394.84]